MVIKAEQVKYRSTRPLLFFPPFNSLALTHASLIWALTRLQASGLAESIMRKERGRATSTLHTHRQASLMMLRYTTLVPPLRLCIGPAREAGLSTGTWRGHVPLRRRKKEKEGRCFTIRMTSGQGATKLRSRFRIFAWIMLIRSKGLTNHSRAISAERIWFI